MQLAGHYLEFRRSTGPAQSGVRDGGSCYLAAGTIANPALKVAQKRDVGNWIL